jgi:cytochrome P450
MPSLVDLVPALTSVLPLRVVARLLGLPEAAEQALRRWRSAIMNVRENWRPVAQTHRELRRVVAETVVEGLPSGCLLDQIIRRLRLSQGRDRIEALLAAVRLLVPAATETTSRGLGNTIFALLQSPDRWRSFVDGSLHPGVAVDEALRWEPPVMATVRHALTDSKLDEFEVRAGTKVLVSLAAANRDPSVFSAPDQFDPERAAPAHLAFGSGPHACLGARLAHLELSMAIQFLAEEFPSLALADPDDAPLRGLLLRGPERLLVRTLTSRY